MGSGRAGWLRWFRGSSLALLAPQPPWVPTVAEVRAQRASKPLKVVLGLNSVGSGRAGWLRWFRGSSLALLAPQPPWSSTSPALAVSHSLATGQLRKRVVVAAHQRFLLLAPPPRDPLLEGEGLLDGVELGVPHQDHRSSATGVTSRRPRCGCAATTSRRGPRCFRRSRCRRCSERCRRGASGQSGSGAGGCGSASGSPVEGRDHGRTCGRTKDGSLDSHLNQRGRDI